MKKIAKKNHEPKAAPSERLDLFLSKKLKITRSQIKKLVDNNQVSVNGTLVTKPGGLIRATDKFAPKAL